MVKQRILIMGGGSFIGSHLAKCVKDGYHVKIFNNFNEKKRIY
jgi:nucleoside-diphosphate-sugar epimerase